MVKFNNFVPYAVGLICGLCVTVKASTGMSPDLETREYAKFTSSTGNVTVVRMALMPPTTGILPPDLTAREYSKFIPAGTNGETAVMAVLIGPVPTNAVLWGAIGGAISNQLDLYTQLTNRYTRSEVDILFGPSNNWNTAYTWVAANSNALAYVLGRSNAWDGAASWVIVHSNDVSTYSTAIARTTLGAEGMRLVGALGGYMLEEFVEDTAVRGPARDRPVFTYQLSPIANLVVSWTNGDVYSPLDGYYHLNAGSNAGSNNWWYGRVE